MCHFVAEEQTTGKGVYWFNTVTMNDPVPATAVAAAGFNVQKQNNVHQD